MGYQVGGNCYGEASAAAAAAASSQVGTVVAAGSALYVVDVSGVSGTSITYEFTPVVSGSSLTITAPFSAQPCGLLEWSDGLTLGWGVAAVWLAAFAVLQLRKAAQS